MNQRRLLILILAALVVYFAWSRGGALIGPGGGIVGGSGSGGRRAVVAAEVEPLALAALEHEAEVFRPGRDLFRFGPARPSGEARPPAMRPPPPRPQPRLESPTPVEAQPSVARPPAIDLTYLGSFGPAGTKIAVFADSETIYNARVGEVIKDVFLLANIGFESVDIEFIGFPDVAAERLAVGGK
jgi:hypothetical protein